MTKKQLEEMIRRVINEETDRVNRHGLGKKIIGYVGSEKVEAFVFPGKDAGLSYYKYKGKTFSGTVKFSRIEKQTTFEY